MWVILLTILLLYTPLLTWAQSCECIKTLRVEQSDPYRYKARPQRCEGRYLRGLTAGGSALPVVGFNSYTEDPHTEEYPNSLSVHLPSAARHSFSRVHITSRSIRTSYLLTTCMSNAHHFKWSSRILREVGVPLDDLLIRATTELEEKQNVLLPALVTVSNTDSISFSKIRISIRPQYHYKQLLVRFKDIDGNVSGSLTDGRQFFAAQRVYDFRIPLARLNGVVRVDILGKRESGTDSNQVYIYVPAAY